MSVHIYKDNLRQNIFRTLVLTDVVIFVLIGGVFAILLLLLYRILFHNAGYLYYLFVLGILESMLFVIGTLKIDNQAIYKILARGLFYTLSRKKNRGSQLDAYFHDFFIQDDLIIRKRSISKVFHIDPYDISALNANERTTFFANLKQTLHTLPTKLQVIVKKEVSTPKDFTDHFLAVYKSLPKGNKTKEQMVSNYQKELTEFVERENLLTIKQYGVFAIQADTAQVKEKVEAIGKLDDMYKRFSSAIESCHISTKQLTNEELAVYMRGLLR